MASQVSTFLSIAQGEIGYIEKKSNSQLDNKTANAGNNNYTKYGAWYNGGVLQAQPWCFESGTLILAPGGFVPIENLEVGDIVLDIYHNPQKVEAINTRIAEDTMSLRANGGLVINTTEEHPFLVKKKMKDGSFNLPDWFAAKDIKKGDKVALERGSFGTKTLNPSVAYMIGRYLGDGWVSNHGGRDEYFICCSYEEAEELEQKMKEAEISFKKDTQPRTCQQYAIHKTNRKAEAKNNELLMSYLHSVGRTADSKRLPNEAWEWDETTTTAFLTGYYAADGTKTTNRQYRFIINTVSKELALGIGSLLRRYGYNLNITTKDPRIEKIQGRTVNCKKQYFCYSTCTQTDYFENEDQFTWVGVKAIDYDKEAAMVYNLTVADTHSFIADGYVVHNCNMFVSWCGYKAGIASLIGNFAYCPSHVNWFKNKGQWYSKGSKTPEPGWIIFFKTGSSYEACHVGIVEKVSNGYVYTIEGNTSGASTLVSNGGGVCRKSYSLSSSYILGYGAPKFSSSGDNTETPVTPVVPSTPSTGTSTSTSSSAKYVSPVTWSNGSTNEDVFSTTQMSGRIGYIYPWSSCSCYGTKKAKFVVVYKIDGTSHYKAGLVAYDGGVTAKEVTGGKTWTNGSTDEPVYIDTRKSKKIGSLNPRESCTCLAKINGMYLVIYQIDGTSHFKVGFVEYSGGLS